MSEEHAWEDRLSIAETLGTGGVRTQTSSSTSITRADSYQSARNAGLKSPTETSNGERMIAHQEDSKTLLSSA